jgi:RNA polymerase sigma-70 factor (ECF subfamily)
MFSGVSGEPAGRPEPIGRSAPAVRRNGLERIVPELIHSQSRRRQELSGLSDRELLARLAGDDEQALAELVARKSQPLVQAVTRILGDAEEARDVVQVALFKLWESRGRYDPKFSPNTWIYRIATNLAIDHWRSRRSREEQREPVRIHLVRASETGDLAALAELKEAEVERIFGELAGELTERQRVVFVLREIEGLPSNEVAEIAGCEESTVRNHLFNARRVLRERLVERYPEYARRGAVRAAGPGGDRG